MIAIIMAGGKSTRMGTEKPLLKIGHKKMVDIAADAIKDSKAEDFFIAVSKNAIKTRKYCLKRYDTIETGGNGYHEDLNELMKSFSEFVSVSSDIPFLRGEHINTIINAYEGCSITGAVLADSIPSGVTPSHVFENDKKKVVTVGLNIVTASINSSVLLFKDPLLGINVNTKEDLRICSNILLKNPVSIEPNHI